MNLPSTNSVEKLVDRAAPIFDHARKAMEANSVSRIPDLLIDSSSSKILFLLEIGYDEESEIF
ncbi:MAG: hypothetical protein HN580_14700 [Deltaproteobacteria bacterium]|jgi:hypothetical protein|nr:hypothetical protein [Deltaproteobacteria bacterium]MBT6616483.1 hypothetical protein [Deltaproteobacteria bacterium]MBT7151943.1 hypothetical protein [Deltaproteobacteria bacterium]MBT7715238.1 hypothetical protein [Deltaproteobacteria bacterium]MBT7890269.1 hypothetical protein [Deltaproteobacteria bacterium]